MQLSAHDEVSQFQSQGINSRGQSVVWICILLVALTWLVFGQTIRHDFVNYDDRTYVYGNPIVTRGLTLRGIAWAFTHAHALYWHPLTTVSHMLDCQLFGLNAGGHHLTNVLLHTIAALLLFLVLTRMTENDFAHAARPAVAPYQNIALWCSAFVAALFAIHPLRVESVAWIAERKDVLSGVLFMLTLGAYLRYTCKRTLSRYLTMSILFVCGLMAKPMLVTLPFVLLLLDYWPLGRIRDESAKVGALIREKIPLIGLSTLFCLATLYAQRNSAASVEAFPLALRIKAALVSYVIYIGQMFWPVNLAVLYPVNPVPLWQSAFALAFLVAISAFAIATRSRRPYIFTGWFWYVGMLVPVTNVVQSGWQSHADRYTYLPQIGLYIAATWAVADIISTFNGQRSTLNAQSRTHRMLGIERWALGVGFFIVAILACQAWNQTGHWKNTEKLWTHTLVVTADNDIAHHNLGLFYTGRGEIDQALSQYHAALRVPPVAGKYRYRGLVHNNLGSALVQKGQLDEAIAHYQKAIELRPDYADARFNLAIAFQANGQLDEAIDQFRRTLSIRPADAEAHVALGNALVQERRLNEAISHFEAALKLDPHSISALNKLAWISATAPDASLREASRAIDLATKADEYSNRADPSVRRTLAAAYAAGGQFDRAIEIADRAAASASGISQDSLVSKLASDVALYREGVALRDFSLSEAGDKR